MYMYVYFVFSRDQHGFTPMHYATMYGQTAILDIFTSRGARIDIVNMGGDTLLHIAAAWGKYDIVQKVRCVCVVHTCTCMCIYNVSCTYAMVAVKKWPF